MSCSYTSFPTVLRGSESLQSENRVGPLTKFDLYHYRPFNGSEQSLSYDSSLREEFTFPFRGMFPSNNEERKEGGI